MADAVAGRTPPSVALVVVAYQAAEHLPPLLESIAALDHPADRLETIVVDNGSTDGTTELLARRYSWVRVLPQTRNLGFAEANNVGARAVDADCVAFVNADMPPARFPSCISRFRRPRLQ